MQLSIPDTDTDLHPLLGRAAAVAPDRKAAVVEFLLGAKVTGEGNPRKPCPICATVVDARIYRSGTLTYDRTLLHLLTAHDLWNADLDEVASALLDDDDEEADHDLSNGHSDEGTNGHANEEALGLPFSEFSEFELDTAPISLSRRDSSEATTPTERRPPAARPRRSRPQESRRPAPREMVDEGGGASFGLDPSDASASIQQAYGLDPDFADEIVRVAGVIGAHPFDLANIIHFESGFRANAKNPNGGATGLIQFRGPSAQMVGTTTSDLAKMSAVEQMEYVERYFRTTARGKPLDTPQKLAMSVFYPVAMEWPSDKPFPQKVADANAYRAESGQVVPMSTPADYVALVERRAKLKPSDVPEPTRAGAPAGPVAPTDGGNVFDQVLAWMGSWFGPPVPAMEGNPPPLALTDRQAGAAVWDLAPGVGGVLVDARGQEWSAGRVPPGSYRFKMNGRPLSSEFRVEEGHRYRASGMGRLFPVD